MKNVFKKAHEITRNIIRKGDSYKETFRLCLIFVYSQIKKGVNKMVELKGTEKQVAWANDIRKNMLEALSLKGKVEKLIAIKKEELEVVEGEKYEVKARFIKRAEWLRNNLEKTEKLILSKEDATFFINRRFMVGQGFEGAMFVTCSLETFIESNFNETIENIDGLMSVVCRLIKKYNL